MHRCITVEQLVLQTNVTHHCTVHFHVAELLTLIWGHRIQKIGFQLLLAVEKKTNNNNIQLCLHHQKQNKKQQPAHSVNTHNVSSFQAAKKL